MLTWAGPNGHGPRRHQTHLRGQAAPPLSSAAASRTRLLAWANAVAPQKLYRSPRRQVKTTGSPPKRVPVRDNGSAGGPRQNDRHFTIRNEEPAGRTPNQSYAVR